MATRRIGELLVAEGLLTEGAVERALGFQRLSGEPIRLGSILLNWDLLGEDALLDALACMHRCPPVPWSVLSAAPIEVVRLLPATHAIRFGAMPYQAEKTLLRVAFVNPGDLAALDEVARIAGRRVAAGIATEIRIMQAHHRFYGRHVPLEFRAIMQKVERRGAGARGTASPPESSAAGTGRSRFTEARRRAPAGVAVQISAPAAASPPSDRPLPQIRIPELTDPDVPVSRAEAPEVFSGEDSLSKWLEDALSAFRDPAWNPGRPSTRVVAPPGVPPQERSREEAAPDGASIERPPDAPAGDPADPVSDMWRPPSAGDPDSGVSRMWTGDPARLALEQAGTREELVEEVVRAVLSDLPRVVVLERGSDSVTGWRGKGPDVTRERVLSVRIPLQDSTVFSRVLATGRAHSGPVESALWPRALAHLLGSDPPDCAVLPILVGRRPVAFLYADRIDQPLQREDVVRLERAAVSISSVLSRSPHARSAPARS